jgi:hypothetical protein
MYPIPDALRAHLSGATQWPGQRLCGYLALVMCEVCLEVNNPLIERLVREMADVIIGVAQRRARGALFDPTPVEVRAIELVASLPVTEIWAALGMLGLTAERVACRLDQLEVQLRAILRDELVRIASRARMPMMELDAEPALVPARLRLVRR